MIFKVFDENSRTWIDFVPYIAYQSFEGSRNDVDGPNAGRVIQNALMERDRLATKYKFTFTTVPLYNEKAVELEGYLMPEFFRVRTDYYSPNSVREYECYSNNITKTYVIYDGQDRVKFTAPIVER